MVGLDPARFERTICASRWPDERASPEASAAALERFERAGVRFIGLKRSSAKDLTAWKPLISMMRRERIDVLHSHGFGSNVWGALTGSLASVPVIVAHEHTWSFEGRPLRKFLDRQLIARRADAFLAVSSEDRRRMIEIEGIPEDKVTFVPNGIPTPGERGEAAGLRTEFGIPPGAPVVGTVCTLRRQKALDVLVGAAVKLRVEFPDLRVLIIGNGKERAYVEEAIARFDAEPTVILAGFRPDATDLVHMFDVAACSSDFEGTPLSILEYMEARVPVVATRVGGIPDMIRPGVEGELVEPRDPSGLAEAIARLLRDPAMARAMGERGRLRRREEFEIGVTVERIAAIYERLRSAPGKPAI
ncbi:glycosyltransferase [Thermoleophilia bacterium SCSIO 60948]|nr:glycosyltransferase [Thermoleophilia bacterium SCSIO 60948]